MHSTLCFFKNPCDIRQLSQTYVSRSCKVHAGSVQRCNVRATPYLFVDLKQTTPEHLYLHTNIVPEPDNEVRLPSEDIKWKHE